MGAEANDFIKVSAERFEWHSWLMSLHFVKAIQGERNGWLHRCRERYWDKNSESTLILQPWSFPSCFTIPQCWGGGQGEQGSGVESRCVPGMEYSRLEQGQGGEGKGKPRLPWSKPETIFKPAAPLPPLHTHCKLLAGILWSSLLQRGATVVVPRKEGLLVPLSYLGQGVQPPAWGGDAAKCWWWENWRSKIQHSCSRV